MMTTKHVLAPPINPEVDSSEGEHVPEQQVQVWSTQILQTRVVTSTEGPGAEGLHPPVLHRGVLQVLHGPLHPQTAGLAGGSLWTMRSTGVLTTWEIIWRGIISESYSNIITDVGPGHGIQFSGDGSPEVREECSTAGIISGVDTECSCQQCYLSTEIFISMLLTLKAYAFSFKCCLPAKFWILLENSVWKSSFSSYLSSFFTTLTSPVCGGKCQETTQVHKILHLNNSSDRTAMFHLLYLIFYSCVLC